MKKTGKVSFKTMGCLLIMLLFACLLIFHNYIFGRDLMVYYDIGSDTKEQYIMWYNGMANMIKSGVFSGWNFKSGFGINTFQLNVFEPFLMAIYFLGSVFGPEKIPFMMVYMQIVKIVLSGLFFYLFLSEHRTRESAKLMASFMYAFNGYLMVWGQHYALGTIVVLFPLFLLFVEKTLRNWHAMFGVALMSGIMILNGYYQAYMVLLASAVYVTIRCWLWGEHTIRERFKVWMIEAWSMAFGILFGALNLLPSAAAALSESSRMDLKYSLFERIVRACDLWNREYYRTSLYRFFGNNLQGIGSKFLGHLNYYEAPNFFLSTLMIVLLVQYFFTFFGQKTTKKEKLAQILGVLFVAFAIGIELGSMIFNGFAYSFARHTFVFLPFMALLAARMLDQILEEKKISMIGVLVSGLLVAGVYAICYKNYQELVYEQNALMLGLTGLGMVAVLFMLKIRKLRQPQAIQLLVLLLFINVVSDSALCYRYRQNVTKDDADYFTQTYHSSTTEALEWLEASDPTFYRVEKDYSNAGTYLEAMAQNYAGVSTYNSTQNKRVAEFVDKLWPQLLTSYDKNHYTFKNTVLTPVLPQLTGIKYILSHNAEAKIDGYKMYQQIGDVYIYRAEQGNSFGKFFTKTMPQSRYDEEKNKLNTWVLLGQVLITDNENKLDLKADDLTEYKIKKIDSVFEAGKFDGEDEKGKLQYGSAQIMTFKIDTEQLAKYRNVIMKCTLSANTEIDCLIEIDGVRSSSHFVSTKTNPKLTFNIPQGSKEVVFSTPDTKGEITVKNVAFYGNKTEYAFNEDAEIRVEKGVSDSHLTGTVNAPEDGMVMLPVPVENGWTLTVDGKEAEITVGDYAFISFPVTKGEHTFSLDFEVPMLKAASIMAVAGVIIWVAGFVAMWIVVLIMRGKRAKADFQSRAEMRREEKQRAKEEKAAKKQAEKEAKAAAKAAKKNGGSSEEPSANVWDQPQTSEPVTGTDASGETDTVSSDPAAGDNPAADTFQDMLNSDSKIDLDFGGGENSAEVPSDNNDEPALADHTGENRIFEDRS